MPRGFCSRVGGVRRCGGGGAVLPGDGALLSCHWLHDSHFHISIPHPLKTPFPACNSFNFLIISSDGILAERSILFFLFLLLYFLQHWLENEGAGFIKATPQRITDMTYCNRAPPVVFIKFSYFTHSQAYCKKAHARMGAVKSTCTPETQLYIFSKQPILPPLCRLWWNRSCHAVTVCARRTNKRFSPGRSDLNGKATWQLCSERPHHQTPHPQLYTSTSGQEAFRSPRRACKTHSTRLPPPSENPFICRIILVPLLK